MIRQGQVVWVDLGGRWGSVPAGRRPAVVIQSVDYNASSLATIDTADVHEVAGDLPLDLWQRVAVGVRQVLHTPFVR